MSLDQPIWRPAYSSRAADDGGVVASTTPTGALALEWLASWKKLSVSHAGQLGRGRNFARGGRVRDVDVAQAGANATVVDGEPVSCSLRVRAFTESEWDRVAEVLLGRLEHIAALLEGEMPPGLVEALKARGVKLVPTQNEIDGECSCLDYMFPCAHVAAVHAVLAEAIEGDPFLLFTLRGRSRDQLFQILRRAWGDELPMRDATLVSEEEPADGDWFASTAPLPDCTFSVQPAAGNGLALRGLGPCPGNADLVAVLDPLFAAGAAAALDIALRQAVEQEEEEAAPRRRTRARSSADNATVRVPVRNSFKTAAEPTAPSTPVLDLTAAVIEYLEELDGSTPEEIGESIGTPAPAVLEELVSLEELGLVYRTTRGRSVRFWLG